MSSQSETLFFSIARGALQFISQMLIFLAQRRGGFEMRRTRIFRASGADRGIVSAVSRCRGEAALVTTATLPSSVLRVACTKSVRASRRPARDRPPTFFHTPLTPPVLTFPQSARSSRDRVRVQGDQVRGNHVHRRPGQGQCVRRDAEEDSGTPTPPRAPRARPSLAPVAPVPTGPPRTPPGSDARSPIALPLPAPSQDKLIDAADVTHMFKITKVIGLCATGKLRA